MKVNSQFLICISFLICFSTSTYSQKTGIEKRIDGIKITLEHPIGNNKGEELYQIAKKKLGNHADDFLYHLEISKSYNESNGNLEIYFESLKLELIYYYTIGQPKKVIELAKNAVSIAKDNSLNKYMAMFYNFMPDSYRLLSELENQYESCELAMEYSERSKDTLQLIIASTNLGILYWSIGEVEKAIETNIKLFLFEKSFDTTRNIANTLTTRASFYRELKKYDQAIFTAKESLKIARTKRDSNFIYINIGTTYYEMDSFSLALPYLEKSFLFFKNTLESNRTMLYYLYKGLIFFKTNDFESANEYLNKALSIADNSSYISEVSEICRVKYLIEKSYGNTSLAFMFLERHKILDDSLRQIKNVNEIATRKLKEDLKEKEAESKWLERSTILLNEKLIVEKKVSRWSIIAFIVSSLIIVLLIVVIIQRRKNNRSKRKIAKLEHSKKIELKNKELVTMKIQRLNRGQKIEELNQQLASVKENLEEKHVDSKKVLKSLNSISNRIDFDTEKDWEEFKLYFEKLNRNFFTSLKSSYPKVTANDEKLCAYIKIGMDQKQISRILNVMPETIKKQKHRLRKKMDLPLNSDIRDYLEF